MSHTRFQDDDLDRLLHTDLQVLITALFRACKLGKWDVVGEIRMILDQDRAMCGGNYIPSIKISDEERAWIVDQLRKELVNLTNLPKEISPYRLSKLFYELNGKGKPLPQDLLDFLWIEACRKTNALSVEKITNMNEANALTELSSGLGLHLIENVITDMNRWMEYISFPPSLLTHPTIVSMLSH